MQKRCDACEYDFDANELVKVDDEYLCADCHYLHLSNIQGAIDEQETMQWLYHHNR